MAGRFLEVRTAAIVAALLDAGATPVDLRNATAFDAGHIPGAVNSVWTAVLGALATTPKSDVILLYGAGGGNADEYAGAFMLEAVGYTKVIYYVGGWANWNVSTE